VPGARDVVTARRPARVRPDEKWVHVSLRRQVLTAYEGDQLVYATLVSTGKRDTPTPRGLYRVWVKTAHEPMHGRAGDPYFVDEVPWAMFFRDGLSLHGTYWHDRFGTPVSHGCVNLSLADARWLFDWAPPSLPIGWHSVIPLAAGRPSLWVLVTR
jgi:lipoprotein-anchoring transpeptidase ErfK/SrfK